MITRDPEHLWYEDGAAVIEDGQILDVGDFDEIRRKYPDAELIDARGGVIMPGLINAHEHIYSAMARGLSVKGYNPKGFLDILEGMWWNIDRHLTLEQTRLSAVTTLIDCVKNIESYKVANILHKHHLQDPNAAWSEVPKMLFENNVKIAEKYFSVPLGVLKKGYVADAIVTDYIPVTPMNAENCNSHILFGMNGRSVTHTICNGKVLMKDRQLTFCDEAEVLAKVREPVGALWRSINE